MAKDDPIGSGFGQEQQISTPEEDYKLGLALSRFMRHAQKSKDFPVFLSFLKKELDKWAVPILNLNAEQRDSDTYRGRIAGIRETNEEMQRLIADSLAEAAQRRQANSEEAGDEEQDA